MGRAHREREREKERKGGAKVRTRASKEGKSADADVATIPLPKLRYDTHASDTCTASAVPVFDTRQTHTSLHCKFCVHVSYAMKGGGFESGGGVVMCGGVVSVFFSCVLHAVVCAIVRRKIYYYRYRYTTTT